MAENIDGGKKRGKRERGGKRVINSLGELGSQPEIQDMLSARPADTPEALQTELQEVRDEIAATQEIEVAPVTPETTVEQPVSDAQQESDTSSHASSESEPIPEPGVEQTGTGFINEPETSDEPEWQRLMRENPEGDNPNVYGRKGWLAQDGGIYLSRKSGRPQYFAHGDKLTFKTGDHAGETVYWDTNTNSFDSVRPQDVVDREEARAQERRLSARERKLKSELTEKEIEVAQHNLRVRLDKLAMDDSNRGVFSQGIDALKTQGHVEQISELLNQFDALTSRRVARAEASEVAPVEVVDETPAPIEKENLEYAQGNLRNRLDALALDDKTRESLSSQIAAAASSNDIVQLSKVIKRKETAAHKASAAAARAEASSVTQQESPAKETVPATEPVGPESATEPVAAPIMKPESVPDAAMVAVQVLSESPTPPRTEAAPSAPKKSPRDIVRERALEERAKRRERLKAAVEDAEAAQPEPEAHRLTDAALPEQPAAPTEQAVETTPSGVDYTVDHHKYDKYPPMSLTDILHDETHQQFFGELLHNIDPNASAAQLRFSQGTATKEDMALMTYATYEYRKWNSQWQQLSQILNEDDVMQFQRSVASLDNIATFVGRERGLEILKNTLRHAAMRDQAAFLHIGHAVYQAHERRGGKRAELAEQTVEDLARELGMSRAEFEQTIDLSTQGKEAATKAEIEKRLRERATGTRKMMDWFTDKTGMTFGGSSAAAAEHAIKEGLYAVGQYRASGIGNLEKLMSDQGIAEQVQLEARDKEPYRPGIEAGPKSFKEMQTEAQKVKQEDVENVVREYIAQDPKWVSGGREYQDRTLSDIKRKTQGALKAGNGFWAKILKFMFGDTFNKAATKATGRPVHVH